VYQKWFISLSYVNSDMLHFCMFGLAFSKVQYDFKMRILNSAGLKLVSFGQYNPVSCSVT